MLIIRKEQMAAFGAIAKTQYVDETVERVGRQFAAACARLGSDRVREVVEEGIERAAKYDIRSRRAVGAYIDLMFRLDPRLETVDEHAWMRDYLEDDQIEGDTKMELIERELASR